MTILRQLRALNSRKKDSEYPEIAPIASAVMEVEYDQSVIDVIAFHSTGPDFIHDKEPDENERTNEWAYLWREYRNWINRRKFLQQRNRLSSLATLALSHAGFSLKEQAAIFGVSVQAIQLRIAYAQKRGWYRHKSIYGALKGDGKEENNNS